MDMEIQLISGNFTPSEASELLTAIFKTKMTFHENKIRTIYESEEDIKHSEKKIMQLEGVLRNALQQIKDSGQTQISLNAHIDVDTTTILIK
jgi:hypothetical protein